MNLFIVYFNLKIKKKIFIFLNLNLAQKLNKKYI